jgi:hypothetical protein
MMPPHPDRIPQGSTYTCNVMTCPKPGEDRVTIPVTVDGVVTDRSVLACLECRRDLWVAIGDVRQLALTPGGAVYVPDMVRSALKRA